MGDKDGGDAGLLLDPADLLPGLEPQTGVQIGKGLVQQQDTGHLHQRPGDGHPLLLTAGKLAGLPIQKAVDLYQGGGFFRLFQHDLPGQLFGALQVFQGEQDVLQHGQMGVQGVILKYQSHAPVFRGQVGHIVVTEKDPAGGGLLQAADHVQGGALAAARGAQQADELSVGDLKGKVVDGNYLAALLPPGGEDLGQVFQLDFHSIAPFVWHMGRIWFIIPPFSLHCKGKDAPLQRRSPAKAGQALLPGRISEASRDQMPRPAVREANISLTHQAVSFQPRKPQTRTTASTMAVSMARFRMEAVGAMPV